jgi:hypothetical protein
MLDDEDVRVGAYYFPSYQPDRRNDEWHGRGWTEWELVRRAEPRFPGHEQPKVPLRRYHDDSNPVTAAETIRLASGHGLDFLLYSWHWFEDGPYLETALEQGFLEAENAEELPFAISWANQDWDNLFPAKRVEGRTVLAPGAVSPASFHAATERVITRYMSRPHYLRVRGAAYFNVFDPLELVAGLGGLDGAAEAVEGFRRRAREAGVGELHLSAGLWGIGGDVPPHLRGWRPVPPQLVARLGFDSTTSYNWFQYIPFSGRMTVDYDETVEIAAEGWGRFSAAHQVPYVPTVSMGWDPSPRSVMTEEYVPSQYPYTHILVGNTPERFGAAVERAIRFAQTSASPRMVIVNSWNEWTEGAFLDLEARHGAGYLEAIAAAKAAVRTR